MFNKFLVGHMNIIANKNPHSGIIINYWWVLTGSNRRPSVRQTDALPAELNTQFCWCRLQELNLQPTDYDSVALPDCAKSAGLILFKSLKYNSKN